MKYNTGLRGEQTRTCKKKNVKMKYNTGLRGELTRTCKPRTEQRKIIPKKNMKSNTGLRGDQKRQCKPRTEQSQLGHLRRRDRPRVYPTHTLFLRLRGGGTFIFLTTCHVHVVTNWKKLTLEFFFLGIGFWWHYERWDLVTVMFLSFFSYLRFWWH